MRDYFADGCCLDTRWKFEFCQTAWWRFGFWVHVDLKAPILSICLGWFIFGFGKMIVWDGYEPDTSTTGDET